MPGAPKKEMMTITISLFAAGYSRGRQPLCVGSAL
jgi:hypothetical protein